MRFDYDIEVNGKREDKEQAVNLPNMISNHAIITKFRMYMHLQRISDV